MKNKSAFTLIELLVVVAIIAVLISILLPALNTAREKSRQVHCMGNVRQMGLAFLMYARDWNGRIPKVYFDSSQTWYHKILPYVNNNFNLFNCITMGSDGSVFAKGWLNNNPNTYTYWKNYNNTMQYGMNALLSAEGNDPQLFNSFCPRLEAITNASQVLVVGDSSWKTQWGGGDPPMTGCNTIWYRFGYKDTPGYFYAALDDRHSGGSNLLFADGHAGWMNKDLAEFSLAKANNIWIARY